MTGKHWLLPEDVIELLPAEAFELETLRRQILDLMRGWGYQLVIPPLVEYLDSLLAGSGRDLERQTFKITDQHSGRLMGVRADMTPQIARIDAHRLPTDDESRYAYCGSVLRTRSESTEPRRNPHIIGAELFGVAAVSADVEIMALLLDIIARLGITGGVLDIGHAGIFAGLVQHYQLNKSQRDTLETLFHSKCRADLDACQQRQIISADCAADVAFLLDAHLWPDPLTAFTERFAAQHPLFAAASDALQACQQQLKRYYPDQALIFDLGSVGNYGYHSGLMFSLYAAGHYGTIARGGRYDGIGEAYGRARPATGFSADLLTLAALATGEYHAETAQILPCPETAAEFAAIQAARAAGSTIRFQHKE